VSGDAEVGFAVADGDPARLYDAAHWHDLAADDFDGHAALVDHTAGSLTSVWQGTAASSYQERSRAVATHFRAAADCSRSASRTLRRYAGELESYQRLGRRCQAEAERWRQQVVADEARLARAERAVHAAEAAVSQAQHEVLAVATAGPAGAVLNAGAGAALAAAHSGLAQAQAAVRDAQRHLHRAEEELHDWESRGRQVWQEAQEAGSRASGAIGSLSVQPPPPGPAVAAPMATGNPGSGSPGAVPAAGAITAAVGPAGAGLPPGAGAAAGGPNLPPVAGGASQGAITFADLKEVGRRFGWSQSELRAWWQVISDESGGNPGAVNPSSGAFGIGQFLGSTYKEYLPFGAGSSNPVDQLNAMAEYIHDRYSTPLAALAHESSCHWY
jgi:Transglycosylase SLT domain